MEENKDKQIDAFLKKQLQDIPLESPAQNFTSNIMDAIQQEENAVTVKYKPLISKKVWLLVAAIIVAIFFIPFQRRESGLLGDFSLDLSFLDQVNLSQLFDLSEFTVSNTAFYAFLLFTVMIFIQATYLKGYFSKRISTDL